MKTREEALKYGLSFPDTYQEAPFHDSNWQLVRYKYNKKAFLWTYEREGFINLNVKVDPETAFFWRKAYSSGCRAIKFQLGLLQSYQELSIKTDSAWF